MVICEEKNSSKDVLDKHADPYPITNGCVPGDEALASNLHASFPHHGGKTRSKDRGDMVAPHGKTSHDKNFSADVIDAKNSNQVIIPVIINANHKLENGIGEVAECKVENVGALEEIAIKPVSFTDVSIASMNISSSQEGNLPILGNCASKSEILIDTHAPTTLHFAVSDSDSSEQSQEGEEKVIETGRQISHLSSLVKDKAFVGGSRSKTGTGKKKKEILSSADAAGTNSDLYMAYKVLGGQQISALLSDVTDSSYSVDKAKLQAGEMNKDTSTREDGQSKTEIDDWEDTVEISSPMLEASDKSGWHPFATKLDCDSGSTALSRKKYSRDFLLTLSDQCTDLPIGFEVVPDVALLFCDQMGTFQLANCEVLSGHTRVIDRPNTNKRVNRSAASYLNGEKWPKSANLISSSHEVGHGARTGVHPGQTASHGVLRNPHNQGGRIHPLSAQGLLHISADADRWQHASSVRRGLIPSPEAPAMEMHKAERKYVVGKVSGDEEAKQRQIKGILNKLTPQNFDKLFEQAKEANIDNAITLAGVISQIFDKALIEPTFCEMYANFCLHLAGALPDFYENNEKITFKRLLLNKCQEEFERGERDQEEVDKMEDVGEVKQSMETKEEKRIRVRRRMLGNIRLIGELFKKKMLTERIMHECIHKLLKSNQNPDEEDIESLCKLMNTIGKMIDNAKAKQHIDAYFGIMKNLSENNNLSSRVRFMLKDAIDLRKNNWQQRRKVEGPKRIEEVHRDAAQERAQAGRNSRGSGMGSSAKRVPPPSNYDARGSVPLSSSMVQSSANLCSVPAPVRGYGSHDVRKEDRYPYASRSASLPLSQRPLGADSITLGPQGGLAKGMSSRGQPLMANPPTTDASAIDGEIRRSLFVSNGHGFTSNGNANSNTRDLGKAGRISDGLSNKAPIDKFMTSSAGNSGDSSLSISFSEEQLRYKSISAIREYYSAKDERELCLCVKELKTPSFYPTMISLWITDSFERKDIDRDLLSKLLVSLCKSDESLLNQAQLMQGFELVLASLEDAVNDAPRAVEFLGRILVQTILDNVISFREIGILIHEGGEEPGHLLEVGLAADVLGSILEITRMEKGEESMNELWRSSLLQLESFRPPLPLKSRKLEQFL